MGSFLYYALNVTKYRQFGFQLTCVNFSVQSWKKSVDHLFSFILVPGSTKRDKIAAI